MDKTCPYCGSNALEVEEEKSTEVCSQCGVVCNEGSFQKGTGLHDTPEICNRFSLSDKRNWRELKWMSSVYNDNPDTSKLVKGRVKEQIERLRLPEDFIPQVLAMMSDIYRPPRKIKGLPRLLTPGIAACIYIVCRRNSVLINYRNAAEASRCKYHSVLKCIRMIGNYLGISLEELKQVNVLDTVLTQLNVTDPLIKDLSHEVDKFCREALIGVGKSEVLKSIGIAQMCIENIQGSPLDGEKFKEVCKQHVCTPMTARYSFNSIKDELVKYGKKIPWINSLNRKNIARFIKEIISFYKDCQSHHNVGVKFEWEKKRENAEVQKESQIQNAKQRVNICQKRCCNKSPLTDDEILHTNCKVSKSSRATAVQEDGSDGKNLSGHTCCPHCCGDSECETYKAHGTSAFCNLTRMDVMIDYLLRKGYTKAEIMSGNPESMFCQEYYRYDVDCEREELDDSDISNNEMHLYIKTDQEITQSKIHSLFMEEQEEDT